MTDITDQDIETAREFIAHVRKYRAVTGPNAVTAVRVLEALLPTPAPTLADEIRGLVYFTMSGENYINDCHERADTLATRVEQMEYDLTEHEEAAEEWEHVTERIIAEREEAREEVKVLTTDLKVALDKVDRLTAERDEALAEVERLTAANENLRKTDNYREFRDKFLTVQKGAESNAESSAETPDPADVKPGEAWKANIWYDDKRHPGTAIKSSGGDWTVTRDDGSRTAYRMNEYVELVSRLVPAPRVITNPDELEALPCRTVILSTGSQSDVYQKDINGEWLDVTSYGYPSRRVIRMENAVTVLWEPGA